MVFNEILAKLTGAGLGIKEIKRLPNDYGNQICLESGQYVNVFDRGTYYVQGKNPKDVEMVLEQGLSDFSKIDNRSSPCAFFHAYLEMIAGKVESGVSIKCPFQCV